jgi:hypothetical protein
VFSSQSAETVKSLSYDDALRLKIIHQKNSKIFLDDKLRQFRTEVRRFGEFLCLYQHGIIAFSQKRSKRTRLSLLPVAPTLEHSASVKCFVSLQFLNPKTVGRTPWKGNQPVARPIPSTNTE